MITIVAVIMSNSQAAIRAWLARSFQQLGRRAITAGVSLVVPTVIAVRTLPILPVCTNEAAEEREPATLGTMHLSRKRQRGLDNEAIEPVQLLTFQQFRTSH